MITILHQNSPPPPPQLPSLYISMELLLSWASYASAWLASLLLLHILRWRWHSHHQRRHRQLNLPPGPKPWPIIGNLNKIGSLPHRSIHKLSRTYGPLMQLKFGSHPIIIASSADMAKQILRTHDLTFSNRPKTAAGKLTTYNCSGMVWSSNGPYLRQARKMCAVELFSPKRLGSFEYIRVEETRAMMSRLYAFSGKEITLRDHLADANMNVISRIAFGKKYLEECENNTNNSNNSVVEPEEFRKMVDELFLLNGILNIGDWIPWLGFLDLQGYEKRMKVVSEKFDRLLEHVIDEHNARRSKADDNNNWVPKDMMDLLLQLADDPSMEVKLTRTRIKAISLELIGGGTESSAVTVEWAVSELLKQPKLLNKAKEELDKVIGRERWVEEKDMPNLPYIEAIMKETMRMHPVAPLLLPRLASKDCNIGGFDVPAGTRALVNVWTIGRDPNVWNSHDPEVFSPERFLAGKDIDIKGNHFELLPFGAGRRMCPGYSLGMKLIQSTLANLIHGFNWKLPGEMAPSDLNMEEIFGLSTPRKIPLSAIVEPRLPNHLYS